MEKKRCFDSLKKVEIIDEELVSHLAKHKIEALELR